MRTFFSLDCSAQNSKCATATCNVRSNSDSGRKKLSKIKSTIDKSINTELVREMADSARGSDNLINRVNNSEDNNNKLQCVYMNARSIVNKMKELELTVREENLDLVAITETWLNDKITDEEISIEGYTLIRNDRKDINKHRGGGVALYIKNELNPIHKTESYIDNFTESVWCNIRCGRELKLLGVCYRAPDS